MAAPILSLNGRWGGRLRFQNIMVVQGDNLTLEVTVRNTDDSAKDLTGGSVSWGVARWPGDDPVTTATGTLSDPTNGVFQVTLPSTEQLFGDYYHEAQFTESGGAVRTVTRGSMRIDKDII